MPSSIARRSRSTLVEAGRSASVYLVRIRRRYSRALFSVTKSCCGDLGDLEPGDVEDEHLALALAQPGADEVGVAVDHGQDLGGQRGSGPAATWRSLSRVSWTRLGLAAQPVGAGRQRASGSAAGCPGPSRRAPASRPPPPARPCPRGRNRRRARGRARRRRAAAARRCRAGRRRWWRGRAAGSGRPLPSRAAATSPIQTTSWSSATTTVIGVASRTTRLHLRGTLYPDASMRTRWVPTSSSVSTDAAVAPSSGASRTTRRVTESTASASRTTSSSACPIRGGKQGADGCRPAGPRPRGGGRPR